MIKVHVVGPYKGYARFINDYVEVPLEEADLIIFTGGEDINPKLYNQEAHATTWFDEDLDSYEIEAWEKIKPHQLVWGTCRGMQLLTALNGGKLVQNVNNHAGPNHEITVGDKQFMVTSLHHQMCYPYDMPEEHYTLLGVSTYPQSTIYQGYDFSEEILITKGEPELIKYHVPNKPICLGIQGHPEMMSHHSPLVQYLNELIYNTLKEIKK